MPTNSSQRSNRGELCDVCETLATVPWAAIALARGDGYNNDMSSNMTEFPPCPHAVGADDAEWRVTLPGPEATEALAAGLAEVVGAGDVVV